MQISTSAARKHLSALITRAQDPRQFVVLTRHGKPVAAIVSMAEMKRIWAIEDRERAISTGKFPVSFTFGKDSKHQTNAEAAEAIQQMQMDRAMERSVLRKAGLSPVPGGELEAEVEKPLPPQKCRWWQRWRRRVDRGTQCD